MLKRMDSNRPLISNELQPPISGDFSLCRLTIQAPANASTACSQAVLAFALLRSALFPRCSSELVPWWSTWEDTEMSDKLGKTRL